SSAGAEGAWMDGDFWRALYTTLVIFGRRPPALAGPLGARADDLERLLGFTLPEGYRGFIEVFGPGELAWHYEIAAPPGPGVDAFWALQALTRERRGLSLQYGGRVCAPALAARLVHFCRSGEAAFGWDLLAVTDEASNECAIYELRDMLYL